MHYTLLFEKNVKYISRDSKFMSLEFPKSTCLRIFNSACSSTLTRLKWK